MTEVNLKRIGKYKFKAQNPSGKSAILDGPLKIGGTEDGLRPMETVLVGLAGCSSFDIISILEKSKQDLKDLDVAVKGQRADSIPAVFTHINLHFKASGNVQLVKLEKACRLSVEKYCSVASMLNKSVEITHTCEVVDS